MTPDAPPSRIRLWPGGLLWLGGVAALVLLEALAPSVDGLKAHPLAAVLLATVVFLGACGALLVAFVRLGLALAPTVALLALGVAADVGLNLWPPIYPLAELGITLALLLVAATAGVLLARGIGDLGRALPVCLVIAVVDLWSVLAPRGVTKELVESFEAGESRLLSFLLTTYPVPGQVGLRSGLGVPDLLFVAAFLGLLRAAGRPFGPSLTAMFLALFGALATGGLLAAPVPALPFLAVGFLAVNWRALILSRREWVQTVGFLLVLTSLLVGVSLLRASAAT